MQRAGEGRLSVVPRPRHRGISLCPPPSRQGGERHLECPGGSRATRWGPGAAVPRVPGGGPGGSVPAAPTFPEAGLCPGSEPGFTLSLHRGPRWRKRMRVGLPSCAHPLSLLGTAPHKRKGLDFPGGWWLRFHLPMQAGEGSILPRELSSHTILQPKH